MVTKLFIKVGTYIIAKIYITMKALIYKYLLAHFPSELCPCISFSYCFEYLQSMQRGDSSGMGYIYAFSMLAGMVRPKFLFYFTKSLHINK